MAKNIDKHPQTPPTTVGNADDRFPSPRTSNDPAKPVTGQPKKPDPDARPTQPAAEDSNRDHPSRAGDAPTPAPGAGIVRDDDRE